MDLKQLESFVRVAELGSFSKAARLLGLNRATLRTKLRRYSLLD